MSEKSSETKAWWTAWWRGGRAVAENTVVRQPMPDDLAEVANAPYAPLKGLAPGSTEAQVRRPSFPDQGARLGVRFDKGGRMVFNLSHRLPVVDFLGANRTFVELQ